MANPDIARNFPCPSDGFRPRVARLFLHPRQPAHYHSERRLFTEFVKARARVGGRITSHVKYRTRTVPKWGPKREHEEERSEMVRKLVPASIFGKSVKMAFMTASRVLVRCAATCLFMAGLPAQNQPSPTVQNLLPPDAMMIETADLSAAVGKPRELVLWLQRPEKILREVDHPGESYCGDSVYGDHWYGPTRLSLIDAEKHEIVNTIEVPDFFEHPGDGHSFPIPFFVPNDFYNVPNPNSKNEGTPKILNLRDLTGEGYPGQFVLFEYEFCGTPLTSVLGYSRVSDRAVQYQVDVLRSNDTPSLDTWVATIFGRQPVSPGHWDFTWEPGHGANRKIHEQVSFDPLGQLFVDQQEIMQQSYR